MTPGTQNDVREGTAALADESAFGGWQAVVGTAVIAAFVAAPTGLPLSEIVGHWIPQVALFGHAVPPAVVTTAFIWSGMVVWLLEGVQSYQASTRRAAQDVSRPHGAPARRPSTRAASPLAAT